MPGIFSIDNTKLLIGRSRLICLEELSTHTFSLQGCAVIPCHIHVNGKTSKRCD